MPSSIFDVWESVPTADELQQFNEVTDNWKNNKAYRQLDWDALYFANKQANALGKETLYYVEAVSYTHLISVVLAGVLSGFVFGMKKVI